jgi:alcohol dehydrogenase class IV
MGESMNYNLLLPQRVVFGWGRRAEIGALAADLGRRAFLVVGSRTLEASGVVGALQQHLAAAGVHSTLLARISAEPDIATVDEAARRIREYAPGLGDLVIAVGGGSAIDLGKAVAALATNPDGESVRDYLEGIGRGLKLTRRPLPVLAVPTTAGTGSEATKNAVISSDDPATKKSLRSDGMMPQCVIIDPELTQSNPPELTAHSGMDAVTQLIESFISCRAQPVPRALCIEGLRAALPSLSRAVRDGTDRAAREALAHAAFLSGVALANSGLGIAHGVAAALGVHCGTAHGLACAVLLPVALQLNRHAARSDLAELARRVLDAGIADDVEAADLFLGHLAQLERDIGIPNRLSELGVTTSLIPSLVLDSRGNSRDGNPRPIPDAELQQALEAAL